MKQHDVFAAVSNEIKSLSVHKSKPVRVAINGIQGTGKTEFARAFVTYLNDNNYDAHHVSIDGYHFEKRIRYRQGRDSAKGYYEDSYNELAFVESVLLRSQASPSQYIEAIYDLETDKALNLAPKTLTNNAVLVVDGSYLFKPVYAPHWDLKIYLKTDFETALERGVNRDAAALGGYENAKRKFEIRYHAASRRYREEINPESLADIVIDNTDFDRLTFL